LNSRFHFFQSDISKTAVPERFTFPFYYQPHELAITAAKELQQYLEAQTDFDHNFGLKDGQEGTVIGKMFGVLVVRNSDGILGYLRAFSGKIANSNHHTGFVPPVFDMLEEGSFFRIGERQLNAWSKELEALETHPEFIDLSQQWQDLLAKEEETVAIQKEVIKTNREKRTLKRTELEQQLSGEELQVAIEELNKQSISDKLVLKDMQRFYQHKKNELQPYLDEWKNNIQSLREKRAKHSANLQQQLIDNYTFLNARGENASLSRIFENSPLGIPAGSGECAAPKLLQYAYLHQLQPIALAEFWWGESPKSDIRVHEQFYPACRGKCEPILGHMLVGLNVDENPLLINPAEEKELPVLFEDEAIIVVNKPSEFLSVPGKNINDSVYTRIKEMRPEAEGPLIVHRLDMSTSGCLVLAKTEQAYRFLQRQFVKRHVKKRYVALLEGVVSEDEGTIELPLRVDLEDRPRQLVCYEHGSPAKTHFKVVERRENRTLIHFFPITGRTHQLRVHSAHQLGLGSPIVGDDLYGTIDSRLHLHAEYLEFQHPVTKRMVKFKAPVPF